MWFTNFTCLCSDTRCMNYSFEIHVIFLKIDDVLYVIFLLDMWVWVLKMKHPSHQSYFVVYFNHLLDILVLTIGTQPLDKKTQYDIINTSMSYDPMHILFILIRTSLFSYQSSVIEYVGSRWYVMLYLEAKQIMTPILCPH